MRDFNVLNGGIAPYYSARVKHPRNVWLSHTIASRCNHGPSLPPYFKAACDAKLYQDELLFFDCLRIGAGSRQ